MKNDSNVVAQQLSLLRVAPASWGCFGFHNKFNVNIKSNANSLCSNSFQLFSLRISTFFNILSIHFGKLAQYSLILSESCIFLFDIYNKLAVRQKYTFPKTRCCLYMYLYLRKFCSVLLLLTLFSTLSEGQVTVKHRKKTVPSSGVFVYDSLKVADFDSLLSIQFAYFWDTKVLKFVDILGFEPLGLKKETHFNLLNTNQGNLRFLWESNNIVRGTSLPDSTPIFIVKFQVVGNSGEYSYLYIDEQKPDFFMEFVQDSSRVAVARDPKIFKGYICVGACTITSTTEPISPTITLFPNPVLNELMVQLSDYNASDISVRLYSIEGVLKKQEQYNDVGQNSILQFGLEDIPPGVYQLAVHDKKNIFSKLIIKE